MSVWISGACQPLIPGLTWTRASDAWQQLASDVNGERWESVGGNNIARVHRPGGSGSPGLLIEPSRTNRCLRSEELENATWVQAGTPSPSANALTAPSGLVTADTLNDNDGATLEGVQQASLGFSIGNIVTLSVFAKNTTSTRSRMVFFNGAAYSNNVDSTSIVWTRLISAPCTIANGPTDNITLLPATSGALPGNVADTGIASFWGAQVELGYATSYMPTVGSVATRSADSCALDTGMLTAHGITAPYGRGQIAWQPVFDNTGEAGAVWLLGISAAAGIRYQGSDDMLEIFSGGARVASLGPLTFAANAMLFMIRFTWNGPFCQIELIKDGANQGAATGTWTMPTFGASLFLGSDVSSANHATGTYSHVRLGS